MKRGTRISLGIVLTVSMLLAGLIIGMWCGGTFLVAKSAGLAGAAEVIWYGLLGAIVAGIIGFVLSRKLNGKPLVWTTVLLGPVGLVLAVLVIRAYSASQKETQAHLEEAYNNLPAFQAVLEQDGGPAFERVEIDWAARRYTAIVDGRSCSARLSGPEAVALLGSLRDADLVLFKNAAPCDNAGATHTLTYTIKESKPPFTVGSVSFGDGCLAQHPALERPFEAARDILQGGDFPKSCQ